MMPGWLYARISGWYCIGRLWVLVHDDGVIASWRQIVFWDWRRKLWKPTDKPEKGKA